MLRWSLPPCPEIGDTRLLAVSDPAIAERIGMAMWSAARRRGSQASIEIVGADVGQGTAVLLRTASHVLVYDTGAAAPSDPTIRSNHPSSPSVKNRSLRLRTVLASTWNRSAVASIVQPLVMTQSTMRRRPFGVSTAFGCWVLA